MRKIIMIVLGIAGIICLLFATVYQATLSYKMFGLIFTRSIIIPHWSAWFYLIGLILTSLLYFVEQEENNE